MIANPLLPYSPRGVKKTSWWITLGLYGYELRGVTVVRVDRRRLRPVYPVDSPLHTSPSTTHPGLVSRGDCDYGTKCLPVTNELRASDGLVTKLCTNLRAPSEVQVS
jgi:hypothetical protein